MRSLTISITVTALLCAFGPLAATRAVAQDDSQTLPAVTVAEVKTASFVQRVPISGNVVARDEVLVDPEVSGHRIAAFEVDIGDEVETGDVLARLDERVLRRQLQLRELALSQAEASLEQARSQVAADQAQLDQANSVLDRAQRLRDSGTGTQASLDDAIAAQAAAQSALTASSDGITVAQSQIEEAKINRDLASDDLDNATITAPVDGIVTARDAQIGSTVSSGQTIFRILRDGAVDVEAEVVETELGQISSGDRAELQIAGIGATVGTVRSIDPTVDPVTRLGVVEIEPEAKEGLRPGLFAGGWIITAERTSLAVPTSAVINDSSTASVLVEKDGTLERREIVAGLIWDDLREVLDGLKEGEHVLARAAGFFSDGDRVRPVTGQGD
ncbi:efflux RND transporter periplasmic adaptor subunit [Sagittula stellata]|uniref:Putative transport transmembrane protein n=1 Tax=Sagittula stellata (strain ATCC 700073 / DSM 11524 / E-37) TaxID=388399 RepID=A3K0T7_SAGS3|nr:efflux RND transporter periplasmic adaptor subunit [Sagittula stellata]EBA09402.1 putative transport transmembrane protein [Sagittula stellata E-37]